MANKGTGAGGANTNANGLPFEEVSQVSNSDEYNIQAEHTYYKVVDFGRNVKFITGKKNKFHTNMSRISTSDFNGKERLHGLKEPDQWFIREDTRDVYIIESKFQQGGGSVCEKLQTAFIKKRRLQRNYGDLVIHYMYALSPWWRDNCPAEIEELQLDKFPIFWGDSPTIRDEIIDFIHSDEVVQH